MLIEQVRAATAEDHKKLEDRLFPFLHTIHSHKQYAQLLNAFYGYIYPVQEKINRFINPAVVPDMNERRNASFIVRDLQHLGIALNTDLCTDLPVINDHPSAMGALYVLEGSTLGGKIIAKTISEKIPSPEAFGFFKGYGPETGPMWKKFTQYLEHPFNQQAAATVVYSATSTFRCFGTWFEKQL